MPSSNELAKRFEKDGWTNDRQKGSHRIYKKGDKTVALPMGRKDLPKGLLRAIFRDAGWNWPPD